jgi:hypothetical protein
MKAEEALEVFGIDVKELEKVESVETFKADVEKTWIKRAEAHNDKDVKSKVSGMYNRVIAKKLGDINTDFEFNIEEFDKKTPVDVLDALVPILKTRLDEVPTLKEQLKKAAPADVVEKFEQEKKELTKKATAFEKNAKDWEGKFNELDTKVKTNDRAGKINGEWEGALKSITFAPTVDELRKEGFVSKMKSKYQILIDDEGKTYLANDKGDRLMNPKKAEAWTLAEALKSDANELKLIGVNQQGGKVVGKPAAFKAAEREETPGRFGVASRREPAAPMK